MKQLLAFLIIGSFLSFPLTSAALPTFPKKLCQEAGYTCKVVKRGDSWQKLWANPTERDLIKRINRMNTPLKPGMTIAVPTNYQYLNQISFSPFPRKMETHGRKTVLVDLSLLAWGAYDNSGKLIKWGPAVGGKSWCPDIKRPCKTVKGTYTFYEKRGADCFSTIFPVDEKGGAPMPYCMFFYKGYALHGSKIVPGKHASHGCVRLFQTDARWLNKEFVTLPKTDVTKIIVRA